MRKTGKGDRVRREMKGGKGEKRKGKGERVRREKERGRG